MTTLARRWLVPGIPFLFSLALSGSTVSSELFWQDSGFYLCAIREMAVLYPHGFVAYQVLCKAWTLIFFFVDLTLAVHLFSSFCAAAAAGCLALCGRDLLRARSPLVRISEDDPGELASWAGAIAGCMAALGYTYWMAAIYAKGYSYFYLILALLLWRMIRTAESRSPRDLTIVAALIGCAWQAHPSAVGTGLCLATFVLLHRTAIGWKGLGWRAAWAALWALGPALLLPVLARNDSPAAFGAPAGAREIWEYLVGQRFVERPDAFGLSGDRWKSASVFFWEEFLGIGLVLMAVGLATIARANRRLLLGLALWILPYMAMTLVFVMEGQHDHWYVAAWLPLSLAVAVGLFEIGRLAGSRARTAMIALGALGAVWSVTVNFPLLNQRGNDLPEILGEIHLKPLSSGAVLLTTSDDATGSTHFLQLVRGRRQDVTLVRPGHLNSGTESRPGWYDRHLSRRRPEFPRPDYAGLRRRFPRAAKLDVDMAAFVNAVVAPDRPVYLEQPPPAEMIRPDYALVPAGPLMKMVPRGSEAIDLRDWEFPITLEEVRLRFRRGRGISGEEMSRGRRRDQEPYERRLFLAILRARLYLAEWHARHGEFRQARDLYEAILRSDPESARVIDVVHPLGVCTVLLGEHSRAKPYLERSLSLEPSPQDRAEALYYLGEISLAEGRPGDARTLFISAGRIPDLPPALRERIARRLDPR